MRVILSAGVLAWLSFALATAADDGPGIPGQIARSDRPVAPAHQTGAANSPLPTQVWWNQHEQCFGVFEGGTGRIAEIDPRTKQVKRTITGQENLVRGFVVTAPNGEWSATINPQTPVLKLANRDMLRFIPALPTSSRLPEPVAVDGNPQALAVTPDSKTVLVACDTTGPAGRRVCFVDVASGKAACRSIFGSSNLRGIAVDPQGKYALAVHLIHKSHLPSTQIEQGWVFTNAVTYLSLDGRDVTVTLPLDLRTQGFANPEGVTISRDGLRAYIAHSGADLVSVVDIPALLEVVNEAVSSKEADKASGKDDVKRPEASPADYQREDLRLTRRYVRARVAVGAGPRGIAVSGDGKFVAVANRLDDSVSLIDAATDSVTATISLIQNDDRTPTEVERLIREGERLFHSGRLSFSGQFSCASCHPDGDTDGLNWDLPADGFNNFHNTKSLLSVNGTAPYGWLGTSATLRDRFTGTLRHLFQHQPTESEAAALEAYLVQLRNPQQVGRPTAAIEAAMARGKAIFEGSAGCSACHSGSKLTDRSVHDIGTGSARQAEFDTPALLRVSATAPYLHDGRAATLEEIFAKHNPAGKHGRASHLAPAQLADLMEYLKSL